MLPVVILAEASAWLVPATSVHAPGHAIGAAILVAWPFALITERAAYPNERRGGGAQYVVDIQDLTSGRSGVRMHIVFRCEVDPVKAEAWLRTVWPVGIDTTWQLPAAISKQLRAAAETLALQPDGLHQLQALL